MVRLHVKKNEESLFLYDCTTDVEITALVDQLAQLQNTRLRITRLAEAIRDLAQHGPAKPETEHGYTQEQLDAAANPTSETAPVEGTNARGDRVLLRPDPLGKRTGEAPLAETAATLTTACDEALALVEKSLVTTGTPLTQKAADEGVHLLRGAVMIAYPMGLPAFDPVQQELDETSDLSGSSAGAAVIERSSVALWWASKELQQTPGRKLSDHVGRNEKSKLVVKLARQGTGAPAREAPMDEAAQKAMMAYYYRKQEEHKKLAEAAADGDDEDGGRAAAWSDPRALKNSFLGLGGGVSWRPR